jgi:exopolysaccharide biosynthesis predicted pyruvyltransferase EpsI
MAITHDRPLERAASSRPVDHQPRPLPEVDPDVLSAILLGRDHQDTVYVPNRGNAGDSLIGEAIFQFFDRIGLSYTTVNLTDRLMKPSRVVIAGGGNLVMPYRNIRDFLENNFDQFEEVVILPHTIQGHEDLLAKLDGRFRLICREERSYDFCRKHASGATVLIGDDMALLWDHEETVARAHAEAFRNLGDATFHMRNIKHLVRRLQYRGKIRNGTLNAFREDVEKADRPVPENSVDVSQAFSTETTTRPYAACAVQAMCLFLDHVDRVRTDRLHVAILSAMLGKAVEMFDNSYGKNRSVYEYSLAGRFPNVTFAG